MLTRKEKLKKLSAIYDKALDTIHGGLGVSKDDVYAGCQALQTVSRELQTLERVMQVLGEDISSKKQAFWHNWGPHEKRQTETEA